MNGRESNATNAKNGESKTTRIMMANVPHVTSGSGLRKFQADEFLFDRVYSSNIGVISSRIKDNTKSLKIILTMTTRLINA